MEVGQIGVAAEHFDVAATTIDVLFMFDGELDHEVFIFVAEGLVELPRDRVKFGVLGRFNT